MNALKRPLMYMIRSWAAFANGQLYASFFEKSLLCRGSSVYTCIYTPLAEYSNQIDAKTFFYNFLLLRIVAQLYK